MSTLRLTDNPRPEFYDEVADGWEIGRDETIPDREEIATMDDYGDMWHWVDRLDATEIRVETMLQYPGDLDRDWFMRTRSLLIKVRIARRAFEKRLKEIQKIIPGPPIKAVAPTT